MYCVIFVWLHESSFADYKPVMASSMRRVFFSLKTKYVESDLSLRNPLWLKLADLVQKYIMHNSSFWILIIVYKIWLERNVIFKFQMTNQYNFRANILFSLYKQPIRISNFYNEIIAYLHFEFFLQGKVFSIF